MSTPNTPVPGRLYKLGEMPTPEGIELEFSINNCLVLGVYNAQKQIVIETRGLSETVPALLAKYPLAEVSHWLLPPAHFASDMEVLRSTRPDTEMDVELCQAIKEILKRHGCKDELILVRYDIKDGIVHGEAAPVSFYHPCNHARAMQSMSIMQLLHPILYPEKP
jgi:hypothetical protein